MMDWNPSAFKHAILAAFIILSANLRCSSTSDGDTRAAIMINQMAILNHSSLLNQHSQVLEKILEVLSQQEQHTQGHTQAIIDLGHGMQRLSDSLIEVQREQSLSMQEVLAKQNEAILDGLLQEKQHIRNHTQAINDLSQGIQRLTESLTQGQSEHLASVTQLQREQSATMQEVLTKQTEVILNGQFQQEQVMQGHSQTINDLTDGVQRLSESLIQIQREHSSSLQSLIEQTKALNNLSVNYMENLGNTCEVSEQQHISSTRKDCVKEDGGVIPHGETLAYECKYFTCENGNLIDSHAPVPEGFSPVSDGCYLPVQIKKNWEDARYYCLGKGFDLATPPSDFEAFRQFFHNIDDGYWWLGGRKNEDDGSFFYVRDRTSVDFRHWYKEEPQQPNSDGNCLCIYTNREPALHDSPCKNDYYFICQLEEN